MFWTIVGAILFIMIVLPIVFKIFMGILNVAFENSTTLGCIVLVILFIILLVIIF